MDSWQSSQGEASQQDSNLRVSLMWHHSALSSSLPGLAPSLPRRQSPPKAGPPKGRLTQHSGCPRGSLYLLSRMASSTWVLFSDTGAPREVWLMADRNFRSNLVLSVFPAPLSPLLRKNTHFIHKSRTGRADDHPTHGTEVISRNKHVTSPLWQAGIRQRQGGWCGYSGRCQSKWKSRSKACDAATE